ncbi:MAG: flagellar protein FlaF [Methanosarcinaceae archaeon]|nr:flagellar protein FlaF [Methanosarcinaceae archaeon]
MGLDTVIVAFFVIEMILVAGGAITMGTSEVLESSYEGYVAIHETTMNRLHTDIEIVSIWKSDVTNHTTFKVQNTGETKLSNFELWDVILIEESQASYLTYNTDYKIVDRYEIINPGILDPHENIEIELLKFDPNNDGIIKIITENGISSSVEYNGSE